MAILTIPEKGITITNLNDISNFFRERNIYFNQWSCEKEFDTNATQEEIISAYSKDLSPFMEKGGYKTADVINIYPEIENYEAIRTKFLAEHTHSEDEIRFFVDGQGLFWFNLETEPVFNLLCERGDLISVPAGTKHWFDAGATRPFVKAIRIFTDLSGWVPHYTDSKIEMRFNDFKIPLKHKVNYLLTDIEGTTSSISFVTDTLFPYFNERIEKLKDLTHLAVVQQAFEETRKIALEQTNEKLDTTAEIIEKLKEWSLADKKITPLKTVQGVIWEEGYKNGDLKGHVYNEVAEMLKKWSDKNLELGVFSSGSITAQKLLFGHSTSGDLTVYFNNYFDTTTGNKRDTDTYIKISKALHLEPATILFLSDITEELVAAKNAGFQTIQLVREGNKANWDRIAVDFTEVDQLMP